MSEIIKYLGKSFMVFQNDGIGKELIDGKEWEPHLMNAIRNLIPMLEDPVVLDIGAHIGTHTVLLADLCEFNGNVIAIEPDKNNRKLLKFNTKEYKNVLIIDKVISDRLDEKTIRHTYPNGSMLNTGDLSFVPQSFVPQSFIPGKESEDSVESITLDSLNLKKCNFIKVDIQGAEIKFLLGGLNTIKKFKPIMIIEAENHTLIRFGETSRNLFRVISELDYNIILLDFEYKSDHLCIHKDNWISFIEKFGSLLKVNLLKNPINDNLPFATLKIVFP